MIRCLRLDCCHRVHLRIAARQILLAAAIYFVGWLSPILSPIVAQTPAGAKFLGTNLKGFGIPFRIDGSNDSYIEVQLYLSEDRGKTWRFHSRQSTDKSEFPFEANSDGEYWFAIKTLNRNRQLIPEGKTQPELVILVDTVKPELLFQIESDAAGRIACRWRAFDQHIDPKTLQIFYQTLDASSDSWTKVPIELNGISRNGIYADQIAWWPETTSLALNVRVSIADTAGNLVQQDRRLNIAPTPWRHRTASTARTGDAVSSGQPSNASPAATPVYPFPSPDKTTQQNPSSIPGNASPAMYGAQPPRIAQAGTQDFRTISLPLVGSEPELAAPPRPDGFAVPQVAQVETKPSSFQPEPFPPAQNIPQQSNQALAANQSAIPWNSEPERWTARDRSQVASTLSPDSSLLPLPYPERPDPKSHLPQSNPGQVKTSGDQVLGQSSTMAPQNQYRGLIPQTEVAKPQLMPATQIAMANNEELPANNPQLSQELVQADQQNWQSGQLPHMNSTMVERINESDSSVQMVGSKRFQLNYGIDAIDPSGVAQVDLWMTQDGGQSWKTWGNDPDRVSPFPVEVDAEGRYGFRIVVRSQDGLTGRGPASGDAPDIWVHVDTQAPLTQLVSVPYGRGAEAGRLVINYCVTDSFLTLRPVTISYSRNPDGPWTAIGAGLRNETRHVWKPAANVPDRIFLKLEALDRAGNVGVHQLSQAIDVSGLVPRGTIHGVTPVAISK